MKWSTIAIYLSILCSTVLIWSCDQNAGKEKRLLIFSKTAGYRHASIEKGVEAIKKLGQENKITVVHSEDASMITEEKLKNFSAVLFLSTTGDIFDAAQQADFERYIQAGGGFVGIHAATDTEYDWPWYGKLVGAYFKSHPKIQEVKIKVEEKGKAFFGNRLGDVWTRKDELYNFKKVPTHVNVLLKLDESSYQGGENEGNHPICWYHEYDGGRSFYTGFGHTEESFEEQEFLDHLLDGIQYAIGPNKLDYAAATTKRLPEENRFRRTILSDNLEEPMELDLLPNGDIIFVERKGMIYIYDLGAGFKRVVTKFPVHTVHEDGLLGVAVDPNYEENNWIYLFYSPVGEKPVQHVSRFVLKDDQLDMSSEKVVLEIPLQRDECCHSGGSLEFGPDGLLYIGVGDNTNPFASNGYAPIDERPGREPWDAQRSSGNTNDLRGKILRIRPLPDGTYEIPEGNLFPPGTPKTRPEIFVMGCRNPFRLDIDTETNYLYWGDVGPDAGKDNPTRGPKGLDGINQARKAGYWGWPYSRGNNQSYFDYDFVTEESGEKFDPKKLINDSPNNTGLRELPPAQSYLIWYSYDKSEEFTWVGTGSKNPMAGPVYHIEDYEGEYKFPDYFDDKLIIYEWARHWIKVVKLDSMGQFVKADPFMPNTTFSRPMDMLFGKDGVLYMIEYGPKWFAQNKEAVLSKIEFVRGNREPIARLACEEPRGAAPMDIVLSASASEDFDGDPLSYEWSINGKKMDAKGATLQHTLELDGEFWVEVKVSDSSGASSKAGQMIVVGNAPPAVAWKVEGNQSFYWSGRNINYQVQVSDKEDGNSSDERFDAERVSISIDYLKEGLDITQIAQGHAAQLAASGVARGANLIKESDCKTCHAINNKINGPSYLEIATKYKGQEKKKPVLAAKIIKGGSGVWGETVMSAHPLLSDGEALAMVDYIFSLGEKETKRVEQMPSDGIYTTTPDPQAYQGVYVLLASYTDLGKGRHEPITVQDQIMLRAPRLEAESASVKPNSVGSKKRNGHQVLAPIKNDTYFAFQHLDLTQVEDITLEMVMRPQHAGGNVKVRINQVDGPVIGEMKFEYNGNLQEQVRIPIEPTNGFHDVYFTFEQPNNKVVGFANWIEFGFGQEVLSLR